MPGLDVNTKLYLPFDENTLGATTVDGALEVLDSGNSGNIITQVNGAVLSTSAKKFGRSSLYLDGTTDKITTPDTGTDFHFGTGGLTFDLWYNPTAKTSYDTFFEMNINSSYFIKFDIGLVSGDTIRPRFYCNWNASTIAGYEVTDAVTVEDGTFYHFALVRDGSSVYIFLNGVSLGLTVVQAIGSSDLGDYNDPFNIGLDSLNAGRDINGYIDEFRYSKTARWTSNFTPETSQYTSDTDTKLLLHMDTQDQSGDGGSDAYHIPNFIGTAQLDTAVTKYAGDTSSGKFDGNSDYVTLPDSTDWDIMGDVTKSWIVDGWLRMASHGDDDGIITQYVTDQNFWMLKHDGDSGPTGLQFYFRSGGSTIVLTPGAGDFGDTNFHYVTLAIIGNGTSFDIGIYKDGTQVTYANTSTTSTFTAPLTLGYALLYGGEGYLNGSMAHWRVQESNIVSASPNAGKTDTITVPTAPYTFEEPVTGWVHTINGVLADTLASVSGVSRAAIATVNQT